MYEIDFARGFVYKGEKGFIIKVNSNGLYIKDGFNKIFLTKYNSRIMEQDEIKGLQNETRKIWTK